MGDIKQITQTIRIYSGIIAKTTREAMEKHLAEKGISLSMLQFGILHMVNHHAFTSAELSRKLSLDPSTLVPAIDALVRKNYIRKERDPDDRRRYLLFLTDEAQRMMNELHAVSDTDPLLAALNTLEDEDIETLQGLMKKIVLSLPDGERILQGIHARVNPESIKDHN